MRRVIGGRKEEGTNEKGDWRKEGRKEGRNERMKQKKKKKREPYLVLQGFLLLRGSVI